MQKNNKEDEADANHDELLHKLNTETGKIRWFELARFFAAGKAVFVDEKLDLIKVAISFADDNRQAIEKLMVDGCVGLVNDKQAAGWTECNAWVWAVVISPWVLVQPVSASNKRA